MGYVKLACSVTKMWHLIGLPNYIVNLQGNPLKKLEGLVYNDFPGPSFNFHICSCKLILY
jgi:hypothetical protein